MTLPVDRGAVSILSRTPVAGETKTRLIPDIGAEQAAKLHCKMLERTVQVAVSSNVGAVELVCTPTIGHPFFESLARCHAIGLELQPEGGLGDKMFVELRRRLATCDFAIVVGADCPGITVEDYQCCAQHLSAGVDAVLGPSRDGGYYLLGVRHANTQLFTNIVWGRDDVAARTRERFTSLALTWRELPQRIDVDRVEDLSSYPDLLPD